MRKLRIPIAFSFSFPSKPLIAAIIDPSGAAVRSVPILNTRKQPEFAGFAPSRLEARWADRFVDSIKSAFIRKDSAAVGFGQGRRRFMLPAVRKRVLSLLSFLAGDTPICPHKFGLSSKVVSDLPKSPANNARF